MNVSSICAFKMPVLRHCDMKRGRALRAMTRIPHTEIGTVVRATTASSGEIVNIMIPTPISNSTDVSIWLSVCCKLCATLSMSLVTRLSRSPRACLSM